MIGQTAKLVATALQPEAMAQRWPIPKPSDDKYGRGVVGIDTGSPRYPGAGVLSTLGALRAGAGFVRYCGADEAKTPLTARCPSITFGRGRVNAWVLGCGWDDERMNVTRLAARLADDVPCVIDAGAMFVIDQALETLGRPSLPPECLLTPHAGELARLLGVERGDVEADPLEAAAQASVRYGAAVLVKGGTQYSVGGERTSGMIAYQAVQGPPWSAQAGSGDVLAGVVGTLLASGCPAVLAGALAASLQAMTATAHPGPWAPDQLANWFPDTVAAIATGQ